MQQIVLRRLNHATKIKLAKGKGVLGPEVKPSTHQLKWSSLLQHNTTKHNTSSCTFNMKMRKQLYDDTWLLG